MKIYVLTLLAMLILSPPSVCDTGVDRTISEVAPCEFDVTLTLDNIKICGITETLPPDLTYVNTTHPDEKFKVSGQRLVFAVLNGTPVTYRVIASTSGTPEITGTWIDLLSDSEGVIGGGVGGAPQVSEQQETTAEAEQQGGAEPQREEEPQNRTEQQSTPGFGIVLLIAMMFVAYFGKGGRFG